jgi:Arc/MetJ-type ribon-helix-helix transcriptional regulator
MTIDARSIYTTALRNTHAMEQQGLQQMEIQVSRLERYPDYASVLRQHIETTRQQLQRLEQALTATGESASSLKETVTTIAGSVGAAIHGLAQDETLKNLYAGLRLSIRADWSLPLPYQDSGGCWRDCLYCVVPTIAPRGRAGRQQGGGSH